MEDTVYVPHTLVLVKQGARARSSHLPLEDLPLEAEDGVIDTEHLAVLAALLERVDLLTPLAKKRRQQLDHGARRVRQRLRRAARRRAHALRDRQAEEICAQSAARRRVRHDEHRLCRGLDLEDARLEAADQVREGLASRVALREAHRSEPLRRPLVLARLRSCGRRRAGEEGERQGETPPPRCPLAPRSSRQTHDVEAHNLGSPRLISDNLGSSRLISGNLGSSRAAVERVEAGDVCHRAADAAPPHVPRDHPRRVDRARLRRREEAEGRGGRVPADPARQLEGEGVVGGGAAALLVGEVAVSGR
mmetsp:Transcript_17915/g.56516  ORF Transcript_17915/g.56516 Transcript_17915/m.56516 type:complete len:306 (-) Transcript_17915:884-1801(-)